MTPQRARAQALWQALGTRLEDAPGYPPGYMRGFLAREAPYFVWWLSFKLPPPAGSRADTLRVLLEVAPPQWSTGLGQRFGQGSDPQARSWLLQAYRAAQVEDDRIAELVALTPSQLAHRLRQSEAVTDRTRTRREHETRIKEAQARQAGRSRTYAVRLRDFRADPYLQEALDLARDAPLEGLKADAAVRLWGEVADGLAAGLGAADSAAATARQLLLLAEAAKYDRLAVGESARHMAGLGGSAARLREQAARVGSAAGRLWYESLALPPMVQALVDEADALEALPPLHKSIVRGACEDARAGDPERLMQELPSERALNAKRKAERAAERAAGERHEQEMEARALAHLREHSDVKLRAMLRGAQQRLAGGALPWAEKGKAEELVRRLQQVLAERAPAAAVSSAPVYPPTMNGDEIEAYIRRISGPHDRESLDDADDADDDETPFDRSKLIYDLTTVPTSIPVSEIVSDVPAGYAALATPFPPIVATDATHIEDGNNRVLAARMRGDRTIPAYVLRKARPIGRANQERLEAERAVGSPTLPPAVDWAQEVEALLHAARTGGGVKEPGGPGEAAVYERLRQRPLKQLRLIAAALKAGIGTRARQSEDAERVRYWIAGEILGRVFAEEEQAAAAPSAAAPPPSAPAEARPIGRADHQERVETRMERLETAADRLRAESKRRLAAADSMASVIPLGQPIMVGHHSEGRDRRYRERIRANYTKGFEAQQKAMELERVAQGVGSAGISSDDPEAVVKLKEKLAALEEEREGRKAVNRAYRAGGWPEVRAMPGMTEEQLAGYMRTMATGLAEVPFPPYSLTNLSARIRDAQARIETLQREAVREDFETLTGPGWEISEDREQNRLVLRFDKKPPKAILDLVDGGWHWSRAQGAHLRLNNAGARRMAGWLAEQLRAATGAA